MPFSGEQSLSRTVSVILPCRFLLFLRNQHQRDPASLGCEGRPTSMLFDQPEDVLMRHFGAKHHDSSSHQEIVKQDALHCQQSSGHVFVYHSTSTSHYCFCYPVHIEQLLRETTNWRVSPPSLHMLPLDAQCEHSRSSLGHVSTRQNLCYKLTPLQVDQLHLTGSKTQVNH